MDKIGVLIVDDHAVVRQGLRTLLELHDEIEVVGEAANGVEAVEQARQLLPDLVLMDLLMPEMDGIEATRSIRALSPATKVIILTSFAEDDNVFPSIKAGAQGYLLKNVSPPDLIKAILAAHDGEVQLDPGIARKLMEEISAKPDKPTANDLTERELEVLRLIARGLNNREIAGELVLSEKTVKTHVSNILSKTGSANRAEAAIYASRHNLV